MLNGIDAEIQCLMSELRMLQSEAVGQPTTDQMYGLLVAALGAMKGFDTWKWHIDPEQNMVFGSHIYLPLADYSVYSRTYPQALGVKFRGVFQPTPRVDEYGNSQVFELRDAEAVIDFPNNSVKFHCPP